MRLIPKDDQLGWAPYGWIVYIIFFFTYPAMKGGATREEWIATAVGGAIFFFLYFRGYWPGKEMTSVIGLTILAVVFYPFNAGAGSLFIYAAAFAGWLPVPRNALLSIGIVEGLCIFESVWFHIHPFNAIWPVLFTVIIGGMNMHQQQVACSNARLRLAHEEIEHLATMAERERIARDLHDVLGHTLSLIILKSELASKLADRDADRARTEIRDVERISRDALAQIRSVVGGFRSGGMVSEVETARQTLAAAGVTLEATLIPAALSPAREAVLALAIREAVTNVIRHAAASSCRIRLAADATALTLTIEDDGRGSSAPFGHGLNGMRERVETIGGTLRRHVGPGTKLVIALPSTTPDVAEQTA